MIILFLIVFIGSISISHVWRNHMFNRLLKYMANQDYTAYMKLLNSLPCKYLFPLYNREYMRLNAYIMQGDTKQIENQFDYLLHRVRLLTKQEFDLLTKAFYFYIDENKKDKAKETLHRLKKVCKDKEYLQRCEEMYDVFIEKKSNHIKMMEKAIETMEGIDRGMYHYMLALQYRYKKNARKEMEHLVCASEDLKDTPYSVKIDELIKGKV